MTDVFISYSVKDTDDAALVRRTLESQNISCWMAPESIPSGSNYAREIPQAIRSAKIFVLILSRAAQASIWVPRELDLAVNEKRVVLPFLLDDCPISDEFHFYLIGVQYCTAYGQKEQALRMLTERCRTILGKPQQPVQRAEEACRSVEMEKALIAMLEPRAAGNKGLSDALDALVNPAQHTARTGTPLLHQEHFYREQNGQLEPLRPQRRAHVLLQALHVPPEEVYMLSDATRADGIPRGFVCSSSGVYFSDWGQASSHVPWRTVLYEDIDISQMDNRVAYRRKDGTILPLTHTVSKEELCSRYAVMFVFLRDNFQLRMSYLKYEKERKENGKS